jgi:nickel/cobalt exporter
VALRRIHFLTALLLVAAFSALCSRGARAHDIPNERVDRSIQVSLSPGTIAIDYEVSLSELTLTQDLRRLVGSMPGAEWREWMDRYGQVTGPLNAKGLLITVSGEPVQLAMRGFDLVIEGHPRYTFHLAGSIPRSGRMRLRDTNYLSSEGTSRLAIRGLEGLVVTGDSLPSDVEQIEIRPKIFLSDEEERRTKQLAVEFRSPRESSGEVPGPVVSRTADTQSPASFDRHAAPREGVALPGLPRLAELLDFTSKTSWFVVVAIAIVLGAAHSIQPGHGKTLVTAVALGPGTRFYQPALLGFVTTVAHTGSVLLIALALWSSGATRVAGLHVALARAAGFTIGAVGFWRLGRQLAGFPEHAGHETSSIAAGNRGLIVLGLSGGAVPCWDAIALLLLAAAVGRLAAGVAMVLAFSVGMGIVLVAAGLVAWKLKAAAVGPDMQSRWRRPLAIASSGILAAIGFYLFLR